MNEIKGRIAELKHLRRYVCELVGDACAKDEQQAVDEGTKLIHDLDTELADLKAQACGLQ